MSNTTLPVMADEDILLWGDVETTGLSPFLANDELLQVAFIVTDRFLNIIGDPYEAVIFQDKEKMFNLSGEFVQNMHASTGLWDRLELEGRPLDVVDGELVEYVRSFQPNPKKVWWAGNSIKLDRDFASAFLPKMFDTVGYRSMDVSSLSFIAKNWYGVEFEKKKTHDAVDDIRESLAELKLYRETIFRTPTITG